MRTDSSIRATWRGVKPRFTISRNFVCFGASMLIIEPSHSAISAGMSPTVDVGAEWNVSGSRDTCMHVGVAGERPEPRALREVVFGRRNRLLVERDRALGAQLGEDPFAVGAHPLLDVSEPDVVEREVGAGEGRCSRPRA